MVRSTSKTELAVATKYPYIKKCWHVKRYPGLNFLASCNKHVLSFFQNFLCSQKCSTETISSLAIGSQRKFADKCSLVWRVGDAAARRFAQHAVAADPRRDQHDEHVQRDGYRHVHPPAPQHDVVLRPAAGGGSTRGRWGRVCGSRSNTGSRTRGMNRVAGCVRFGTHSTFLSVLRCCTIFVVQ